MALGLGLPYLILGTFSGLLARLPQSGTWMVQVKKIFGLVLLGAGGFYLGLAVAPDWAYYAVPAVLVLGGAYLAYLALRTRPGGTAQNALRVGAAFAGAAALAGAVWFVQVLQADGVAWASYSDEVVAKAQAQSQPVVLDFTADWCIPCQELDRITFTDDQVVEAMEGVQPVKVDLTETGTPRTKRLRSKYDVAGVPTIAFLDENGEEVTDARTVGFVGPDEFLSRLRKIESISASEENATPKSGGGTARSQ